MLSRGGPGGAERAVAVMVVATPCPLILAAPVALVSGLSAAGRRGVVVKSGGVLERLARCTTLILDKTGTLTAGQPAVTGVVPAGSLPPEEILTLAACLDQVSGRVLAAAIVRAGAERAGPLVLPEAADAVLTVDHLGRLGEVAALARRTRRIARQSALAGMGMSLAAMGAAAAGLLPAVWGALLQEAIDVAVILNALRALRPPAPDVRVTPAYTDLTDLRGVLYGLHAILRLHTVQEDETYLSLGDSTDAVAA